MAVLRRGERPGAHYSVWFGLDSSGSELEQIVGSCVPGNESVVFVKPEKFSINLSF